MLWKRSYLIELDFAIFVNIIFDDDLQNCYYYYYCYYIFLFFCFYCFLFFLFWFYIVFFVRFFFSYSWSSVSFCGYHGKKKMSGEDHTTFNSEFVYVHIIYCSSVLRETPHGLRLFNIFLLYLDKLWRGPRKLRLWICLLHYSSHVLCNFNNLIFNTNITMLVFIFPQRK